MTCIVSPTKYPTKKALREAVAAAPQRVWIDDPSFLAPRFFAAASIPAGRTEVVTNHPKRSWFAQVGRKASGELFVK